MRHKRRQYNSWVGKIPRRRAWQPTPVFLPGEPHGQRSLAGYSPWDHKESDMTEATWHTRTVNSQFSSILQVRLTVPAQRHSTPALILLGVLAQAMGSHLQIAELS